jgi:hypothetical protein
MLEGVKALIRYLPLSRFSEKTDVVYPKLDGENFLLPFADLPRLEKAEVNEPPN